VPLILNVETKKISPQFHVIFDDTFATVHSLPSSKSIDAQWKEILKFDRECFAEMDYDDDGEPILPLLSDIIKAYRDERTQRSDHQLALPPPPDDYENHVTFPNSSDETPFPDYPLVPLPIPSPGGDSQAHKEDTESGGEVAVSGGETNVHNSGRPRRNVGTYKDGPAKIRCLPIDGESYEFAYSNKHFLGNMRPVPAITNVAHCPSTYHPTEKLQKQFIAECYLLQDKWFQKNDCCSSLAQHMPVDTWDDGTSNIYFNDIADPRILAARSATKKATDSEDTPSFDTAIRSPFQAQWWKAMYDELQTIMVDFDCWEYVKRTPEMNVLPSTWAFKLKRYPDGRVKKFKARFCARGDRQQEGIDYFETWAPVVQWSTVRIVMILAIKLNLISVQCDITWSSSSY
jgi:hypothetical protein